MAVEDTHYFNISIYNTEKIVLIYRVILSFLTEILNIMLQKLGLVLLRKVVENHLRV